MAHYTSALHHDKRGAEALILSHINDRLSTFPCSSIQAITPIISCHTILSTYQNAELTLVLSGSPLPIITAWPYHRLHNSHLLSLWSEPITARFAHSYHRTQQQDPLPRQRQSSSLFSHHTRLHIRMYAFTNPDTAVAIHDISYNPSPKTYPPIYTGYRIDTHNKIIRKR